MKDIALYIMGGCGKVVNSSIAKTSQGQHVHASFTHVLLVV